MSDRIPRERQGRWHDRRGFGSRGPAKGAAHPSMPLPDASAQQPSDDGTTGLGSPDGHSGPLLPADPPQ
ncbi:hypothetical protein [Kitasatospora sp. NPDC018619]|uniref:hypothetical protein n=1 Tax=unclassified Kitasatospora TaxID=2633591 RepID=UPI0037A90F9D